MSETTLTKYAGKQAANYCTMPKIDVVILPRVTHCAESGCDKVVRYDQQGMRWVHEDETTEHYVAPRTRCSYCNTEDPAEVQYRQHAWHDAVECKRCGGVLGFAIGD